MWRKRYMLLLIATTAFLPISDGCQMEGVANWLLTVSAEVGDTHRGVFLRRSTTNIAEVTGFETTGGGVDAARYLVAAMDGSDFVIRTNDEAFEYYEEYETSQDMRLTVYFRCAGDLGTNQLLFDIHVIDSNNNSPTFSSEGLYEFTILPPLPPGFQITGCFQDNIIVRDIDLTTQRIDFTIEENPYFEIAYDGRSADDPKEFVAILKTKDLIRTLPDVVDLTISATDVDTTGDPPRTSTATVRIQANDDYEFPEEPVFAQPVYRATYTETDQVDMETLISLQQGYHNDVTFSLEGEHSDYFILDRNGNEISIRVARALTSEILSIPQIILVVRAVREHTSGATTTVIVQTPQVLELEFQQTHYEGTIIDNVLQPIQLTLTQGYTDGVDVSISNEYASFFVSAVQGNIITLSMRALDAQVIDENNFITLVVTAANEYSSASAVVTLDIIKDDNLTPVFEKPLYTGEYDLVTGLALEQIILQQGYDETVSVSLQGEHSSNFQLSRNGAVISLTSSTLPTEIILEQRVLLTVAATKPRSVPVTTAIVITMPTVRELRFNSSIYTGTLLENSLRLQPIVLDVGYDDDVTFSLTGEHSNLFIVSHVQGVVTISLWDTAMPDEVILENNFLTLTLHADGVFALPTSTSVVLEIIKQDITTPVFTENIYQAVYMGPNDIDVGNINLAQGFDDTVIFSLAGEHSEYFRVTNVGNELTLLLEMDIPDEVIFNEKVLVFNILAAKPMTVGANSVVTVTFPAELTDAAVMRFERNTYVGEIKDDLLTLGNILLETGYATGAQFTLRGDHESYFTIGNTNNVVTISLNSLNPLPDNIIEENRFIILEVIASRERAVSVVASIAIDIVKEEIEVPVFSEVYYRGVLADEVLQFSGEISLSQGFDDTVTFELEGAHSAWFVLTQDGNSATIALNSTTGIPGDILEGNNQLLFSVTAIKPGTVDATAAISIDLPKEVGEPVIMRFSDSSYVGRIENGELHPPTITLLGDRDPIQLTLTGEFAPYFQATQVLNTVQLQPTSELPTDEIEGLSFIILNIQASYPETISGYATIVLEIIKEPQIVTPVFDQAYYTGEYSQQGLQFEQSITLAQGFDESVVFTLDGDDAGWFRLEVVDENNLSLEVIGEELNEVRSRSHLTFSVVASKPNSIAGRAAVIINLAAFTSNTTLRFAENIYKGSIENGELTMSEINLEEGYSADVVFLVSGDYKEYFVLTHQENVITLELSELPANVTENNNILVLTLEAQIDSITAAQTVVILELVNPEIIVHAFEEAYYVGTFSILRGLAFDQRIALTEAHDETISFSLEGGDAQWFGIDEDENSISLTQLLPIPNEVTSNTQQFIFVIEANKAGNVIAMSTIIISVINDVTVLEFDRYTYLGSIENDFAHIDTIVLSRGFNENTNFTLLGELAPYFSFTQVEALITVNLETSIPVESIPSNGIILLELQASAPDAISAYASLIFGVVRNDIEILRFNEVYYTGLYTEAEGLNFQDTISLSEGYDENVVFSLDGDDAGYFELVISGNEVSLRMRPDSVIPPAVLLTNQQLIFTIRAARTSAVPAIATIVILLSDDYTAPAILGFDRISYLGSIENDNVNLDQITLREGYSENSVTVSVHGDLSDYFIVSIEETVVTVTLEDPIPEQAVPNNRIIVLELRASAPETLPAYATLVFKVIENETTSELQPLVFSETYYTGYYTENEGLTFDHTITLRQGYNDDVEFDLEGDSSIYFQLTVMNNSVTLGVSSIPIPPTIITNNQHLIFTITAERFDMIARATIVIALRNEVTQETVLGFERINYVGSIEQNVITLETIVLSEGYSADVTFVLHGDLSSYFAINIEANSITLSLPNDIPEDILASNDIIVLELQATAPGVMSTYATIILENIPEVIAALEFSEAYYTGQYTEDDEFVFEENIILTQGYDETVVFELTGAYSDLFSLTPNENEITLSLNSPTIPQEILESNRKLIFVVVATKPRTLTKRATIIISLPNDSGDCETDSGLRFDKILFEGQVQGNEVRHENIHLSGYEGDNVEIIGVYADLFKATITNGVVTVEREISIALPTDLNHISLELQVDTASAVLVLEVIQSDSGDCEVDSGLSFDKILFVGQVQGDEVRHENIHLSGYEEDNVEIMGVYADLFKATITNGVVTVERESSIALPTDLNHISLELQVDTASAVLVLEVIQSEVEPVLPTVTFSSVSYVVRAGADQTGTVGRVGATADNNEAIAYSLDVADAHLLQRLSINNDGALQLSAPALSGDYIFNVVATTVFSRATATAPVRLTVEDVETGSGENNLVPPLPPLQVIDRDEESAHRNLVALDTTVFEGCRYRLTNRWPTNQQWLYVDEEGLHTRAIDREYESIAFMALSQVQVELILECDRDEASSRAKRSINSETRLDHLGPYDYGDNKWLLGDTIQYNARRSLVNLIVNDINDNAPIFIGKQDEPLVVAYPIPELEERILPRALAELQATDADVGENAALVYWSDHEVLAVSPRTGSVHVRSLAQLVNNDILTVNATDRNGQGLTGSLNLLVKLVDTSHIAVVTIRNAFADEEKSILSRLSAAIGYEVRVLTSTVVPIGIGLQIEEADTRNKREVDLSTGASLQLYVYGLIDREPVNVNQLTGDINNVAASVNIASTVSLGDHLESLETGRDTGLLVSTIVLAVLLFILIVVAAVWFFLKWRKDRNYEKFNDENSVASQDEPLPSPPKPEVVPKPRINIDDLKRSERRLQEMLDVPVPEITIEEPPPKATESIVNILDAPIVIQSIDKLKDNEESEDDDEFGERLKAKRKSVVTFNENVEKIIHVEDPPDDSDYEVYKL